jgi:glycosyltransferase involved in cell wall biosynthesis
MKKKLSIIVPVYNEVNTVGIILNKLVNLKLFNNFKKELIVIDDCSTDGSIDIIRKFKIKYGFIKTI